MLFKGLSLFCFVMLNVFIGDEVYTFLMVVMFAAADFWTVKNVTGRLLVNLRWWSEIDENGDEEYQFESDDGKKIVGKTDQFIFWSTLYGTPIVWGFLGFMDLITFKMFWFMACMICFTLSYQNASCYY